jgi:hypothetical protein
MTDLSEMAELVMGRRERPNGPGGALKGVMASMRWDGTGVEGGSPGAGGPLRSGLPGSGD